jgi:predicted Zn-dependent protease
MMATGYDPKELVRLLESWQQRETAEVPWMQFVPGFVKTHPNPGKRGLAIAEKARQLEADYPHAVAIGVQNLLERQPAKTVVVPLHR